MRLWERFLSKLSLPAEEAPTEKTPVEKAPNVNSIPVAPIPPAEVPSPASAAANRNTQGYPITYQSFAADGEKMVRPKVFEPALKHFGRALRLGDPLFNDPALRAKWNEARSEVVCHLVKMVSASRWQESLVLRGSLLLKAWLGDAAREPGDIDWVFRPMQAAIDGPESAALFAELRAMASKFPATKSAKIDAGKIAVDDIWTYERASGRRIVFPWTAAGLPPGQAQMDVVFGEDLFTDPVLTQIPLLGADSAIVWSATKEMSLAWKLLWLETDSYPQGKDFYDAVLLAEQTTPSLPIDLLERVLLAGDWRPELPLRADFPLHWSVDWENFQKEYPWILSAGEDWQKRLAAALAPLFAAREADAN